MKRCLLLFCVLVGPLVPHFLGLVKQGPPEKTIVQLAAATPDLSTLVTAVKAGGLVDTLSGPGPFTVFAPTNEAFASLPPGVLNHLLEPRNKQELVKVLTYHVISGAIRSNDLRPDQSVRTVEGQNLEIR